MLITFSGTDRAGTSALAEWLCRELERGPRRVAVLHLSEPVGVTAWLRALRRRAPVPRRAWARRTILRNRGLRRALYLADLAVFLVYRGVLEQLGGRVVIMDRYFYDMLVEAGGSRLRGWGRLLGRITPRPDLPVLLEDVPEDAPSAERLRDEDDAYRRIFRRVLAPLRLCARETESSRRLLATAVRNHLGHAHDRLF